MPDHQSYDIPHLREQMLKHLGASADAYPEAVERGFPHVLDNMVKFWGTAAMDEYLDSLMVSNRPSRQGFPPQAAKEIFRLSLLHGALGLKKEVKIAGWSAVSDGEISKYFEKNN